MDWREVTLMQQRHQQLLRESRLRHLLARDSYEHNPFYGPWLAQLGQWMVAWGWRLRARYGEVEQQVVRVK